MPDSPEIRDRDASEADVIEEHQEVDGDVVHGDPALRDAESKLSRDPEVPEADALEQSEPFVVDDDEDARPHAAMDDYE